MGAPIICCTKQGRHVAFFGVTEVNRVGNRDSYSRICLIATKASRHGEDWEPAEFLQLPQTTQPHRSTIHSPVSGIFEPGSRSSSPRYATRVGLVSICASRPHRAHTPRLARGNQIL